ncbi:type I restriction-modification system subunit M N-terminal domain-containing protein [Persicitalea sp.]|uniref:type I restriction-modification system subunit M N-terminal domain-containing protein n=1 Tax=Persicitalea sp. TaxID=3100273 RepID=UPI0035941E44
MTNLKGTLDGIRRIMWQDTGLNGDAQRIEQLGWMLFLKIFSDKDQELEVTNDAYVSPIPAKLHWTSWAADDEGMTGDALVEFVDRTLFRCANCRWARAAELPTSAPCWCGRCFRAITIT